MKNNKCKICRRLGVKLLLKGEKCFSPKCPMIKKPFPPGMKSKRMRRHNLSEYGIELKEKQKLKNWYNLQENQFKKYAKEVLDKKKSAEDLTAILIKKLEFRFDNLVFRIGFASSHSQARQLISHNHFLINGKSVNIPSYQLKKGDKIGIRSSSKKKAIFQELLSKSKEEKISSWLSVDIKKLEAEIISYPTLEEFLPPVEVSTVLEYYSR
ncbi:MAG: 30S ribosomal protein S4 [Patescibacteria group bacterium]|nr:30S ribosomal protein S4 [Patescibacteria group bacterium]